MGLLQIQDFVCGRITRNELNQFIQNDAKGAAVRSRARWIEFGEKNSRYFLGLEKWHNDKKFIKSLKNTQENLVNDQKLILEELVNFYEKLYFETETNNSELANNLLFPKINEKENMECEKPIAESECFKAVLNYQITSFCFWAGWFFY